MENQKLLQIIKEFKNYNIYDLITKISSLNIIPENQNKVGIFDSLINFLLSENPQEFNSQNKISSNKFKNLINRWKDNYEIGIDPIEMPFIQRIQFYGNKWVFSGINISSAYNLQNFLDVLFKLNNNFNTKFLHNARLICDLILLLSTSIAEKMKYSIKDLQHYETNDIVYPNNYKIDMLSNAIKFNVDDLADLYGSELLNQLEINFDKQNKVNNFNNDNYKFFHYPILRVSNKHVIVLNPTMLAPFLIHSIISLANQYNEKDTLIREYNNNIWYNTKQYLENLGHKKLKEESVGFKCLNTDTYKEMLLSVANDGVLFVRFFCDDGKNYNFGKIFGIKNIQEKTFDGRIEKLKDNIPKFAQNKVYQLVIINNFNRTINCSFEDKSNVGIIQLSPFELQCVSINEKKHKFFLPRYMENKNILAENSFMQLSEFTYITHFSDNNYSFYANDEIDVRKTLLFRGYGDSVDYINKALKKDDKYLIDYPQDNYFREIKILDEFRNIYIDTSQQRMALLNKFCNIKIWNTCNKPQDNIDLNLKSSLLDLTSYWLSELKDVIEKTSFSVASIIIEHIITGDPKDYLMIKDIEEKSLADLLLIEKIDEYTLQIKWNSAAFHKFKDNEHQIEKELLTLIINNLITFTNKKDNIIINDNIFANELKTKIYSLDVQAHPYYKPIEGKVRKISEECIEKLLYEIGDYIKMSQNLPFGIITKDKHNICTEIVSFLYNKLKTEISKYSCNKFYECVYYDLEIIMYQMMLTQKRYAYELACYPEKAEEFEKSYSDLNTSSIANKFLLEYIAACPPTGEIPLGEMDYEYLLAICALIIEWAHVSDLFYYKMIDNDLKMLVSGRVGFGKENISRLSQNNLVAAQKKLNEISNPFIDSFSPKNTIDMEFLNNAYLCENGYTFTQFFICGSELIRLGESIKGEVKICNSDKVLSEVSKNTSFDINIVEKIFNDLTLSRREDYLNPDLPFDRNDVLPWKFNRRLSFNRRPIIKKDDKFIWGNRQLYHSLLFTYDIIDECRYKAYSQEMKSYVGHIANKRGDSFNDKVFDKFNVFKDLIACKKIKKINNLKITNEKNQILGDIDLLLILPFKRKIIVVETKDFSLSKTPYELYQQYVNIFCDTDKRDCYLTKHKKRVSWVKEHINDVIQEFNLSGNKWKVEDLLITSEPIISNEFYNKNQKILLFSEISQKSIYDL